MPKSITSPLTTLLTQPKKKIFFLVEDFSPILFTISFWHFMCSPDDDDSDDGDMLFAISSICWIFRRAKKKSNCYFSFTNSFFSLLFVCASSNFLQKKKKKNAKANKKTDREEKKRKKSNFIISAATCVRQREKVQRTISRLLLNMKKKRFVRVILNIASHIAIYFSSALLFFCDFFSCCSPHRAQAKSLLAPTREWSRTRHEMIFFSFLFLGLSRVIVARMWLQAGATVSKQQSKYICIITSSALFFRGLLKFIWWRKYAARRINNLTHTCELIFNRH